MSLHGPGDMRPDRWELGSAFHLVAPAAGADTRWPWSGDHAGFATGRGALAAVALHGRHIRGWRRLWVPSHFCQEVLAPLLELGLEVAVYPAAPDAPPDERVHVPAVAHDAVLDVQLFGLDAGSRLARDWPAGVEVVEDHTHDPLSRWAVESHADWCLASLRKSLPLPDGAVLWSPRRHPLPTPVVDAAPARGAAERLAAMSLKRLYLAGDYDDRDHYRRLELDGETRLGAAPPAAMSVWSRGLLGAVPATAWRERRRTNHRRLAAELADCPGARLLRPAADDAAPFVGTLLCDTPALRDDLRRALVASRIYPPVLWPLEPALVAGIPPAHVALSRRILGLSCDFRYDEEDMRRVARSVRDALAALADGREVA